MSGRPHIRVAALAALLALVAPAALAQSTLSGRVGALSGDVSTLEGLVEALGGEIRGSEVHVALPADVLFDFDRADIRPAAEGDLQTLVQLIGKTSGTVRIQGHTDSKGTADYNMALSRRRAGAVATWLGANGVPRARLRAEGFGAGRPVALNAHPDGSDDPAGRSRNRRVEVVMPAP